MKNILFRIPLFACILLLFLVFLGFFSFGPPPPPPGTSSQYSESGNITEGTPPGSGNNFWVNTIHAGSPDCFPVLNQSYIILDRSFRIRLNDFVGTNLDVEVRFEDALGNPVLANFLGQVDSQFSTTVNLLNMTSDLEIIPGCGNSGKGITNTSCFDIRFYLTCNVPANFPYSKKVFMFVDFYETSTLLTVGTGVPVTVIHNDEDFEVELTACVEYETFPIGQYGKRLAKSDALEGQFTYSPNPFTDWLNFRVSNEVDDNLSFRLLTLQGAEVRKSGWIEASGSLRWDLADLSSGVYLLEVRDEKGDMSYQKLIK